MAIITMTTFLTVDGVMQAPGGLEEDRSDGFDLGGWLVPYVDEVFGRYVTEWFEPADAFLLGRRTYDIFAATWPHNTDDVVAPKLNNLPKYVASHTLTDPEWKNTTVIRDVVNEVRELKTKPYREIQVHGSGRLAQTLIDHDLIDEYRLWVFPVFLGRGRRLFGGGVFPGALRLVESKTTTTGVVVSTYRPDGRARFGKLAVGG